MKCPACSAEVDAEQDFCMDCGEPIAQAAVVEVPAKAPPAPKPPLAPSPDLRTTLPGKASARRPVEEPEKIRCPGCGMASHAQRCPSCGTRLRHDDD